VFGFGVDLGYIKRFKSFARMICFFGRGGGVEENSEFWSFGCRREIAKVGCGSKEA
jgi:hypothetical protein